MPSSRLESSCSSQAWREFPLAQYSHTTHRTEAAGRPRQYSSFRTKRELSLSPGVALSRTPSAPYRYLQEHPPRNLELLPKLGLFGGRPCRAAEASTRSLSPI